MKFHYKMPSPIGFQLAPMLDIVFLLLVFFIVTQTFEDDEPDLSINLPSAETPKPGENVSNEIIVNIRKDGTVEPLLLHVRGLTEDEKEIILDGCLMNYYAKRAD